MVACQYVVAALLVEPYGSLNVFRLGSLDVIFNEGGNALAVRILHQPPVAHVADHIAGNSIVQANIMTPPVVVYSLPHNCTELYPLLRPLCRVLMSSTATDVFVDDEDVKDGTCGEISTCIFYLRL